jgi:hypothetical protein
MVKSKVGSLSSADATEEKGDDHVVDDVADDLKLQHHSNSNNHTFHLATWISFLTAVSSTRQHVPQKVTFLHPFNDSYSFMTLLSVSH